MTALRAILQEHIDSSPSNRRRACLEVGVDSSLANKLLGTSPKKSVRSEHEPLVEGLLRYMQRQGFLIAGDAWAWEQAVTGAYRYMAMRDAVPSRSYQQARNGSMIPRDEQREHANTYLNLIDSRSPVSAAHAYLLRTGITASTMRAWLAKYCGQCAASRRRSQFPTLRKRTLDALVKHGPCTWQDLAAKLDAPGGSIRGCVCKLRHEGLIIPNSKRGKFCLYELTALGLQEINTGKQ